MTPNHDLPFKLCVSFSSLLVLTMNLYVVAPPILYSNDANYRQTFFHNHPSPSCCKVYDVTPFMDEHPGGDEVLLAATRKDATNDFEDVGHSDSARDLMDKYCIGKIDASTIPAKRVFVPPPETPYNPDKTSGFIIKILQFLAPIMILGLAFAVRYYTKAE